MINWPEANARERIPPVLVPLIQSKWSMMVPPKYSSSTSSIWIKINPRIPPPSKHRTRPLEFVILNQNELMTIEIPPWNSYTVNIIISTTSAGLYYCLVWLTPAECWQIDSSIESKKWRWRLVVPSAELEVDWPSSFPNGLHPSPQLTNFEAHRLLPT